ncbi:MAG TPA: 4-hydroxy-3-methylbut-2-enyl diphosphate reductase [Candidatus Sulfotelmatobacter sp.]|nr:4-hydroxy-3-methylbut-2-enyl diphosphate reductase [Candidatus Sulfotelmatobacter sp.]
MAIERLQIRPETNIPLTVERVLVAGNRGPCGGVNMAIEAANQVLDIVEGRETVYTNWDIVNNTPVMDRFRQRGIINVKNDLDRIPNNSIVLFSAHGVPPNYHDVAAEKGFLTIDTTCQLVTRVHTLAKNAEREGKHIVYIGKDKHPETVGVMGEVKSENITFLEPESNINGLELPLGKDVVVYSQTTLATDEVRDQQERLKERFPQIIIPKRWDICGATDTRQQAAESLLDDHQVDFLLVAGSSHSHNSLELKRKAEKRKIPSALVDRPEDVDRNWFTNGVKTIGATSGASEIEEDFQKILDFFRNEGIDPIVYVPQVVIERDLTFRLPQKDIDALRKRYV